MYLPAKASDIITSQANHYSSRTGKVYLHKLKEEMIAMGRIPVKMTLLNMMVREHNRPRRAESVRPLEPESKPLLWRN